MATRSNRLYVVESGTGIAFVRNQSEVQRQEQRDLSNWDPSKTTGRSNWAVNEISSACKRRMGRDGDTGVTTAEDGTEKKLFWQTCARGGGVLIVTGHQKMESSLSCHATG